MSPDPADQRGIARFIPPIHRVAVITASLLSLEIAALLLNRDSWNAGGVTILWPSNGFLAGALLRTPKRQWPAYLAIGYLVDFALNCYLAQNASMWTSVYLSGCNMLEVVLAAALCSASAAPGFVSATAAADKRPVRPWVASRCATAPAG